MAARENFCAELEVFHDEANIDKYFSPQAASYIVTRSNLLSGEPGVQVGELSDSLDAQYDELKKDPDTFNDVIMHLAIVDTLKEQVREEAA